MYFTPKEQGKGLWGPIWEFGKHFINIPTDCRADCIVGPAILSPAEFVRNIHNKCWKVLQGPLHQGGVI